MPCSLLRSKPKEMRMLLVILFSLIIGCAAQEQKSCKRIVCVVDNLNVPKDFIENETPKDYCTHIVYDSAALVGNNLTHMFTYELSVRGRKGLYAKLNTFKRHKPSLKTLLRVSVPWSAPKPFATLVAREDNRKEFISAAIIYLRKNKFDGLDIDWRYPTKDGVSKEKTHFNAILKEASEAFQKEAQNSINERLLLSATGHPFEVDYYEVSEIARYVDFMNINSFMFYGPWESYIMHHSPLYGYDGGVSAHSSLEIWKSNGMPADKLNLGIAFFAMYVHVENKMQPSYRMDIVHEENPRYTPQSSGYMSFSEVCKFTSDQNYVHREDFQQEPYYFRNGLWMGYEDRLSVEKKGKFAMENGYGVWVETVHLDDHNGTVCEMGKYPLLRSVVSGCNMPSS